jgi:hypothetical protein
MSSTPHEHHFAKERMSAEVVTEFDKQIKNLLLPLYGDSLMPFQVVGKVTWGQPL